MSGRGHRFTQSFVDARKGPFLSNNRIWIGGGEGFPTDVPGYDAVCEPGQDDQSSFPSREHTARPRTI